ncbi:ATP-binding protein [Rhodobacter sp. TJ_12]|uniref:ATP-binding protein n=1 Tax=Rhodobacter sp. TJ_12 TaxID=2029399 RepID=UPI001CBEC8D6|nr:ATP-binding protein [Rhodobacter sp. TJ_12]
MLADGSQPGRGGLDKAPPRPEAKIFHHSFAATPLAVRTALRTALARFLRQLTPDEAGTLELVLAEVLNNIVEHGYGETGHGTITLSLVRDHRGLSCSISDDGVELPPACLARSIDDTHRPEPHTLPEGGFGWFLIHDLVEDLGYHRENGRNLLAFRMPMPPVSNN